MERDPKPAFLVRSLWDATLGRKPEAQEDELTLLHLTVISEHHDSLQQLLQTSEVQVNKPQPVLNDKENTVTTKDETSPTTQYGLDGRAAPAST
jgi:hypothetical protein